MHSAILELNNAIGGNKNVAVYGYADTLMAAHHLDVVLSRIGVSTAANTVTAVVDCDKLDAVIAALQENLGFENVRVSKVESAVKFSIGGHSYSVIADANKCKVHELGGFTNVHADAAFTWASNIYHQTHVQRLATAYQQYEAYRSTANVLALYMAYAVYEFKMYGAANMLSVYLENVNAERPDANVVAAITKLIPLIDSFDKLFSTDEVGIQHMTKYLHEIHPSAVEL